jgi:hypothetical protein
MPTKRSGIPTCHASCSSGHKPEHNLPAKLRAISQAGFYVIELSMPDLLPFANEKPKKEVGPKDYDDLCQVGPKVKKVMPRIRLKDLDSATACDF